MIAGLGAQFLGMARAAIAVTLDILRTKVPLIRAPRYTSARVCLPTSLHPARGRCRRRGHLHTSMTALWDTVSRQLPTAEDRAALYSAGLHATAIGRACIVTMHAAAGTPLSIVTVPWNGAYAICTRWRNILRRNRCGWRMRDACW